MTATDWYNFVTEHLTRDQLTGLSHPDPLRRREYALSQLSRPLLFAPGEATPTSGLVDRLTSLLTEAPAFWQRHTAATPTSNESSSYRIFLDGAHGNHAPSDLRRLGVFFDQIVYPCPLEELYRLWIARGFRVNQHNLAVLSLRLGGLLAARDIHRVTSPLSAIDVVPTALDMDEVSRKADGHTLQLLQSLLLTIEASSITVLRQGLQLLKDAVLPSLVRDHQLVEGIRDRLEAHYASTSVREVIGEAPDGSLTITPLNATMPRNWDLRELLSNIAWMLQHVVRSAATSYILASRADADVLHGPGIAAYLDPFAASTQAALSLGGLEPPEEVILARGLLQPKLGFLEALSTESLARIRQDLDDLRRDLRLSRSALRTALRDGEAAAVATFADHFTHVIGHADSRLAEAIQRRKVQRAKVLAAALGTLSLTAAASIFPIIGLPALGLGLTVGGLFWSTDLITAWREVRDVKGELKRLANGPLNLLAAVMVPTTRQVPPPTA